MEFDRKVQEFGGSLGSTFPSTMTKALNIKKSDTVRFIVDFDVNPPVITVVNVNNIDE